MGVLSPKLNKLPHAAAAQFVILNKLYMSSIVPRYSRNKVEVVSSMIPKVQTSSYSGLDCLGKDEPLPQDDVKLSIRTLKFSETMKSSSRKPNTIVLYSSQMANAVSFN